MNAGEYFVLAVIGLCLGSFLNVLIERTKSGESIIFPFSKCPKCNHSLIWWHNIPLLSYIMLKGKCYFCNRTISIKYPLIELLGCGIVIFSFSRYVSIPDAIAAVIILSILFAVTVIDSDIKKIDLRLVAVLFGAGLLLNRYNPQNSLLNALIASGIVAALIVISEKVFKKAAFGLGDLFLIGACAATVGQNQLFLFLAATVIIQFILVIPKYALQLIEIKQVETLKYLIIFFITCLFFYVSKNISFWGSILVLMGFLAIMCFSAYKIIRNLFYNIKTDKNEVYCPFAPAIAIACIIFLIL